MPWHLPTARKPCGAFDLRAVLMSATIAAAWALLPTITLAESLPTPLLVGDYSPGVASYEFLPRNFAAIGDRLFFTGYDPQHGDEPWVSDGTPAGTRRLADVCPGSCFSYSGSFEALGQRVVFYSLANEALYALVGDEVEELARGLPQARQFTRLGPLIYFSVGSSGQEKIWRTDGTAAGTRLADDFCCFPVDDFAAAGGALYFSMGGSVFALFGEGDRRNLGSFGYSTHFVSLDASRVVFRSCAAQPCAAAASDGSAAGTRLLEPTTGGTLTAGPENFVAWRGRIYFNNQEGQLVSTDGTPAGTRLESGFSGLYPRPFAATSNVLLYTAEVPNPSGPNSILYAKHASGGADTPLTSPTYNYSQQGFFGDKVFLQAASSLIVTDGTVAGTETLDEVYASSFGVPFQGRYYFGLDPQGGEIGAGLWSSDGTRAGTALIDLDLGYSLGTQVQPYRLGNSLVAFLDPSTPQLETLYRIDPQTFATAPVDARRLAPLAAGHQLLYATQTSQLPASLVAVSATSSVDLPAASITESGLAADDRFYFTDRSPGQTLSETDGTAAGTRLLFDQRPGFVPSCSGHHCEPDFPLEITPSGDRVFFIGPTPDDDISRTLWAWRRGEAQPVAIHELDFYFSGPVAVPGGRALFTAARDSGASSPASLWLSDGTPAGTRPFFDLPGNSGNGYDGLFRYALAGSRLFFEVLNPRRSLWVTDFTTAGTRLLLEAEGFALQEMVAAGDRLFFTGVARQGEGREIGVSDGKPEGTRWLDLKPGEAGSFPAGLFPVSGRRVVFAASADQAGYELWISGGTQADTYRLTDLAPGPDASTPNSFAEVGRRLFFAATDGHHGHELWALDLPPAWPECPPQGLCLADGQFEVQVTAHAPDGDFIGKRAAGTAESAVFTFFSANNWEMLVKVLDGCAINQKFWVFAASATDVAFTLKVIDRATGEEKIYRNAAGQAAPAITDTGAFSCL